MYWDEAVFSSIKIGCVYFEPKSVEPKSEFVRVGMVTQAHDFSRYTPYPKAQTLSEWLKESHRLTLRILDALKPGQENVLYSPTLNPPYWEFGHIAWFHELWVHRLGNFSNLSILDQADQLFNSAIVAHRDRWQLEIPHISCIRAYLETMYQKTQDKLQSSLSEQEAYYVQLVIFHQDMHNEAFAYMWQALGYPWLGGLETDNEPPTSTNSFLTGELGHQSEDILVASGSLILGAEPNSGFIFDNEKWSHVVHVPEFQIASLPVLNADYLEYVEHQLHIGDMHKKPAYWKKDSGHWYERHFEQWQEIDLARPVRHISQLAAQDYCHWARRRLPTEYELFGLMKQPSTQWQPAGLWEWTSSIFVPFAGFSTDPYVEYSKPWFDGNYRVLKGFSAFTPPRLRRTGFRNFYDPDRFDMFCGFRTCAL